jgi:hypothetical protein
MFKNTRSENGPQKKNPAALILLALGLVFGLGLKFSKGVRTGIESQSSQISTTKGGIASAGSAALLASRSTTAEETARGESHLPGDFDQRKESLFRNLPTIEGAKSLSPEKKHHGDADAIFKAAEAVVQFVSYLQETPAAHPEGLDALKSCALSTVFTPAVRALCASQVQKLDGENSVLLSDLDQGTLKLLHHFQN